MKRFAAALALLVLAVVELSAQSSPVAIQGQVVAADGNGEPIAHARILVYENKIPEAVFFSDNDGRFAFTISSAKDRRIVVSKAGYAAEDMTLSSLTLSNPLDVRLRRGGAISGRVIDPQGEPYANATVNLIQVRPGSDVPTLKTAHTDDLGEYRLWGIAEGTDYVVELAVMQRDMLAVFYPATDKIDLAERITVRAGVEKTGVDFMTDTVRPLPSIEGRAMMAIAENNSLVIITSGRVFNPQDAQRPLTGGHGVVRGRVTLPSGTPIAAATVQLASVTALRPSRSVTTDDEGRFVVDALPSGDYIVGAAKAGYVSSDGDGDRDPQPGSQIRLADGEVRTTVDLVLARPAVITGRVLDEFGEPFEGALVSVWQTRYENGRRRLVGTTKSVNATDDRGRYRVINVPPGRYFVAASTGIETPERSVGDVPGYTLTYFPAAVAVSEAQPIDITRTTSVTELDIALVRMPTARVTGRVVGPNGAPVSLVFANLEVSYRSKAVLGPTFSSMRLENGRFEFTNIPPGDYVIQVNGPSRMNRSTEGDFAAQFVTVTSTDVTEVVLNAAAGSTIAGRLTFDGGDAPSTPDFGIVPESADFDLAPREARYIARAELRPDLTFEVRGIHGPRRIAITSSPGGWVLKSVSAKGVDVTDRALPFGLPQQSLNDVEIVLTKRLTELAGTVTDRRGDVTRNYTLLAFPADRERWYPGSRYFRRAVPNVDGSFTVRGLPPADYYVAAVSVGSVPTEGETAWQDPEFLESIALRAAFATLTEGQKLSISARLITP